MRRYARPLSADSRETHRRMPDRRDWPKGPTVDGSPKPDVRSVGTGQSPRCQSFHLRPVDFTRRHRGSESLPDGASRTAVHRLSTRTLCASMIHPLWADKRPGQNL